MHPVFIPHKHLVLIETFECPHFWRANLVNTSVQIYCDFCKSSRLNLALFPSFSVGIDTFECKLLNICSFEIRALEANCVTRLNTTSTINRNVKRSSFRVFWQSQDQHDFFVLL